MKKGDIALIVAFLILLALWLFPAKSGDCVNIYVDGEIYKSLPLEKDSEIIVKSEFGTNTVVIRGKKVFVADATCPDKLCEKHTIEKAGRSIVCLPNRMSRVIEGEKYDEKIDVII